METRHERIELLFDTFLDTPLRDELDVFPLVLVRNLDVLTTGLELDRDFLAETLVLDREGAVDDVGDVVVHRPAESTMELGIHTLHIKQVDLLLQDHLVECANEEGVQESPMEDSQADHTSNKLEVAQMLRIDSRVRIDLESIVVVCRVFEQTVEWVEHLV